MTSVARFEALLWSVMMVLAFATAPASAQVTARSPLVTLDLGRGSSIKYLGLAKPGTRAKAAAILFAGGNGLLNLRAGGAIGTNLSGNFLVRSRDRFVAQSLFVAVVDTPNQQTIDGNVRLSADYAGAIGRVIEDMRARLDGGAKVWLVGTSSGTLSAASVAARLGDGGPRTPDGVVLTATQTTLVRGYCGRTVFNASLATITVPVLVVSHLADGCACSPAQAAGDVIAALSRAPAKHSQTFSGGAPAISKDPCMAMTPHGFLGIEDKVVATIAAWIRQH